MFDLRRFAGVWYDVARVDLATEAFLLSTPVSEYSIVNDHLGLKLSVKYGGQLNGRCVHPLAASGRLNATNNARLELAFDDYPLAFLRGSFWVIETNYDYALVYGCFRERPDGACEAGFELAYVLGRRRSLPEPLLRRVQYIIRHRLCIEGVRLRMVDQGGRVCPPDPAFDKEAYLASIKEAGDPPEYSVVPLLNFPEEVETTTEAPPETTAMPEITDVGTTDILETTDPETTEAITTEELVEETPEEEQISTTAVILTATEHHIADEPEALEIAEGVLLLPTTPSSENVVDAADENVTDDDPVVGSPSEIPDTTTTDAVVSEEEVPVEEEEVVAVKVKELGEEQSSEEHVETDTDADPTVAAETVDVEDVETADDVSPLPTSVLETPPTSFATSPEPDVDAVANDCQFDTIPTQQDFQVDRFLGQWYTIATYSSVPMNIDSKVTLLSRDGNGVINLLFTGSSEGNCLTTFRGYMKTMSNDAGKLDASYGIQKGPLKVVYISPDYDYALTYQCGNASPRNGACGAVIVDVIARSPDLSQTALTDVMRRVGELCARPSAFRFVSHTVSCPLDSQVDCRVDNFRAQPNLDWTRFAGRWYTVAMVRGRQRSESVSWRFKKRLPNGNVPVSYRAAVDGQCLKPVQLVLTPTDGVADSGNVNVAVGKQDGRHHTGKIVYTDYHEVAIWYECEAEDVTGSCPPNRIHLEILQRTASASGSLYLMHHELIRSLCVDPKQLELVTHEVDCSDSQKCDLTQFVPSLGFDITTFSGTWNVLATSSGSSFPEVRQLTFRSVGTNHVIGACISAIDGNAQQCRASECFVLQPSSSQRPGDFESTQVGERSGIWRVMRANSENALLYICSRPMTADDVCSPGNQLLVVLARPDAEPMTADELHEYVTSTISGLCLSEFNVTAVDTTSELSCLVQQPPYSQSINALPAAVDVDLERLLGMWYRTETTVPSPPPIIRVRLARESTDGRLDITLSASLNGTCQPPRRYLANITDTTKSDWMLLGTDRSLMHVRLLYTDYTDVALVYVCRKLLFHGVCSPDGDGHIDVYTRGPMINDERRRSMEDQLRYRGYAGIAGFVDKAGFDSSLLTTVGHRVPCPLQIEDASCPVDSLPLLRRFQIKKFLGVWYLVARLRNSPSPETGLLRVSMAEDDSITAVYFGTRNGVCQKPIRQQWTPVVGGSEAEFNVRHLDVTMATGVSKLRVVYTDYRSALVYQCLQLLNDGTCVPGQVVVELMSRRATMPEVKLKAQLIRRVSDLCVENSNMQETKYDADCSFTDDSTCYIDEFPKAQNMPPVNQLVGSWYPLYSAKRPRDNIRTLLEITESSDATLAVTSHYINNDSECWSRSTRLFSFSDRPFQFVVGFPENNVYFRVMEVASDHVVLFTCTYVEGDGKCQSGHNNYYILGRSRNQEIPAGVLAVYAYQATGLCIDDFFSDFVKVSAPACVQQAEGLSLPQCNVDTLDTQQLYNDQLLLGSWRRVGVLAGETVYTDAWYHIRFQVRNRTTFLIHYTGTRNGSCVPTTTATLSPSSAGRGEYILNYQQQQEELSLLFTDGDVSVISRCSERDSRGRCLSDRVLVEVLGRNTTLPYDIERTLIAAGFSRCFTPQQIRLLVNKYSETFEHECLLEVEPECRANVPPRRGSVDLDLDQLKGHWLSIAVLNKTTEVEGSFHTDQLYIEVSEDLSSLHVASVFSRGQTCVSSTKRSFMQTAGDKYEWRTKYLSLEETFLVLHADDEHLILLECLNQDGAACSPDSMIIEIFARGRFEPSEEENKKLAAILRRTCNELHEFRRFDSGVICDMAPSDQTPCPGLEMLPYQTGLKMPFLTGTWHAVARFPGTSLENLEVLRIVGDEQLPNVDYSIIYVTSRHGKCLSPARARLETIVGNDYGDLLLTFPKSAVRLSVLYSDYRHLVVRHCSDYAPSPDISAINDGTQTDDNVTATVDEALVDQGPPVAAACPADRSSIAIYSRSSEFQPTVIQDLASVVRLSSSCAASFERHQPNQGEDSCPVWLPSCSVSSVTPARNFSSDQLLGLWHSIYHLSSSSVWDSASYRFQRDEETGNIAVFTAGTRAGACQPFVNYTFAESIDGRAEWRSLVAESEAVLKILWSDATHALMYMCRRVLSNGMCDPESLYVNVLSRDIVVAGVKPDAVLQLSVALRAACQELGDLHMSSYRIMCPVPSLRKTGCKINQMPVAKVVDNNKLGGVWYSYYLLHSSRQLDFSIVILQPTLSDSFIAMFRGARNDECLAAQTATLEPRAEVEYLTADFDAKFKNFKGRLQFLYTDYDYALVYECAEENPLNGKCQPQHAQAAIYGRMKQNGRLPDDVYQKLVAVANDACLYLEDFVPTTMPTEVNCDLPYSGRRSCRIDDVLTLESFDAREIYGNWRLLSRTTNMADGNQSESLRFSLGVGGVMKYSRTIEDSLGACRSTEGVVDIVNNMPATFTYSIAETTYLLKVLYMNAQYLIVHLCRATMHGADSESGIGCVSEADVKIYGRTSLMSLSVLRQLKSIARPRTCVNLANLETVKLNEKCDLPDGCKIQDYIVQENLDHNMLAGTWQVLVRSTFRQSSTMPSSVKFTPENGGTVRLSRTRYAGSDDGCLVDIARMYPEDEVPGFFNTLYSHTSAITLVLYANDDHLVTLDCIGGVKGEGECTAERVELTVWGRTWSLAPATRARLLQETRDRTLRCYATSTMVDVQPNENCELPPTECSVNQFLLQNDFDPRSVLGLWHLRARTSGSETGRETEAMRISLSSSTLYVTRAGTQMLDNDCYSDTETVQILSDQNATLLWTRENRRLYTQVIVSTDDTLVLLHCDGLQSPSQYCTPGVATLDIYIRRDAVTDDERAKRQLLLDVRERTRTCISTGDLLDVPISDVCEVPAPAKGGESCLYSDIRAAHDGFTLPQLAGTWFLIARTSRVLHMQADSIVMHVAIDNSQFVNLSLAFIPSSKMAAGCSVTMSPAQLITSRPFELLNTLQLGAKNYTTLMTVVYADDDHVIFYECFNRQRTPHGNCDFRNEHVEIFARRRSVNTVERHRLIDIAAQRTCLDLSEFIYTDHSIKCEIPGHLELTHSANKSCTVDSYRVAKDFDPKKFVGVWHEIERTRYSHSTLWESSVISFSVGSSDDVLFAAYTGTRNGSCVGPMTAHATRTSPRGPPGDMMLWVGPVEHRGGPWAVPFRYKIIETDNHVAIIYSCHAVKDDGTCHRQSEQVDILSRHPAMTDAVLGYLHSIVSERLCVDVHDFVKPAHQANCLETGRADESEKEIVAESAPAALIQAPPAMRLKATPPPIDDDDDQTAAPRPHRTTVTVPSASEISSSTAGWDGNCPMPMCNDYCPLGLALDEHGCVTCTCVTAPDDLTVTTTARAMPVSPSGGGASPQPPEAWFDPSELLEIIEVYDSPAEEERRALHHLPGSESGP
jgi:lipocalin